MSLPFYFILSIACNLSFREISFPFENDFATPMFSVYFVFRALVLVVFLLLFICENVVLFNFYEIVVTLVEP